MQAGVSRRLMGDTLAHLARAAAWLAARSPRPDAVIVTGDLVDGADPAEYERFAAAVRELPQPCYVVPGNHDRTAPLRDSLPEFDYLPRTGRLNYAIEHHAVRIVGIDSTERGRAGGFVDAATLGWLDETLRADLRPTVLSLHHPPFRTGVRYMDAFGFIGLEPLRALIAKHEHVRLVASGHVHRAFRTSLGRATLWTSLSTAPQVVPEVFERFPLWVRFEPAGLSLHEWDGAVGGFVSRAYAADRAAGFVERPSVVSLPR
jgi:3',5'-cyclic AMP phosphodiesterase CpdA